MAVICPTVTAQDPHAYRAQMNRITPFAKRIHIDLMDGLFAPTISPKPSQIWWPDGITADIHLMYQKPMEYIEQLIEAHPHLVIIHNEADVHHMHFAALLHRAGIEVGLALLHDTPVEYAEQIMHSFDHVLIFSGNLGFHGGVADLRLMEKIAQIRQNHPDVEIGWDGGINIENVQKLCRAGVDVLNIGGAVQQSDDPAAAYATLNSAISDL
ncbi:MAG TPA: hypothetical protein VFN56_01425 [Candidatus Saccharimonadales bacterium]|nr:hypothetical protein [Candidatus Saccharimonadales bacterium]